MFLFSRYLFSCFFLSSIYVETQPACASCVYMSYSIYRPMCRPYQVHMHILWFYGFYSAVSPAVQLLPPKLIFEPGICHNALLPFCYMPRHPLPADTVTAICNIHHISCRGYLQESVEETCLPVSRVVSSLSSPFSYPMHFIGLLGLPHFS